VIYYDNFVVLNFVADRTTGILWLLKVVYIFLHLIVHFHIILNKV